MAQGNFISFKIEIYNPLNVILELSLYADSFGSGEFQIILINPIF